MAANHTQRHTLCNMQRAAAPRFELHLVCSHLTPLSPPEQVPEMQTADPRPVRPSREDQATRVLLVSRALFRTTDNVA